MRIRIYNHLGLATGYGRAAEALCMSLLRAGNCECSLQIRPLQSYDSLDWELIRPELRPFVAHDRDLHGADVVIVHTLPVDLHKAKQLIEMDHRLIGAKYVAYTTWEASTATSLVIERCSGFDQVWHPSEASAQSYRAFLPNHTHVVPHAYDESAPISTAKLEKSSGAYTFHYVGAWNSRKNVDGLIRAFAYEFASCPQDKADNVELRIHSRHSRAQASDTFALLTCMGYWPPQVTISADELSEVDLASMTAHSDCFVTATRGEAWNLPAFDAALAGCHVIAPDGMGHCEFLDVGNYTLYGGRPAPVTQDVIMVNGERKIVGAQGLHVLDRWIDPDLLELARKMREAYQARRSGPRDPHARTFTYGHAGKIAMAKLDQLFSNPSLDTVGGGR